MKVYKGENNTSVLEFNKIKGSFSDFGKKIETIRENLKVLESQVLEAYE